MKTDAPILFLYRWELESMDDYSCSLPSAQTPGKLWRRHFPYNGKEEDWTWTVGMYCEPIGDRVPIIWFDVVMRQGPEPPCYCPPDWSHFSEWQRRKRRLRAV